MFGASIGCAELEPRAVLAPGGDAPSAPTTPHLARLAAPLRVAGPGPVQGRRGSDMAGLGSAAGAQTLADPVLPRVAAPRARAPGACTRQPRRCQIQIGRWPVPCTGLGGGGRTLSALIPRCWRAPGCCLRSDLLSLRLAAHSGGGELAASWRRKRRTQARAAALAFFSAQLLPDGLFNRITLPRSQHGGEGQPVSWLQNTGDVLAGLVLVHFRTLPHHNARRLPSKSGP